MRWLSLQLICDMLLQCCCDSSNTNKLHCMCFLCVVILADFAMCKTTQATLFCICCKWGVTSLAGQNNSELWQLIFYKTQTDTSAEVSVRNVYIFARLLNSR